MPRFRGAGSGSGSELSPNLRVLLRSVPTRREGNPPPVVGPRVDTSTQRCRSRLLFDVDMRGPRRRPIRRRPGRARARATSRRARHARARSATAVIRAAAPPRGARRRSPRTSSGRAYRRAGSQMLWPFNPVAMMVTHAYAAVRARAGPNPVAEPEPAPWTLGTSEPRNPGTQTSAILPPCRSF